MISLILSAPMTYNQIVRRTEQLSTSLVTYGVHMDSYLSGLPFVPYVLAEFDPAPPSYMTINLLPFLCWNKEKSSLSSQLTARANSNTSP